MTTFNNYRLYLFFAASSHSYHSSQTRAAAVLICFSRIRHVSAPQACATLIDFGTWRICSGVPLQSSGARPPLRSALFLISVQVKRQARRIPLSLGGMATAPRANFTWRRANRAPPSCANYPREGPLHKVWPRAGAARLPSEQGN